MSDTTTHQSPITTRQFMTDIAIRVSNLSKCYQIYDTPRDRLKQFVVPQLCRAIPALHKLFPTPHSSLSTSCPPTFYKEFWALNDVSFEVKKGESFAIIGRNGSGKSTLLQMICGTLNPTGGIVQTNGRIAALLELGSGFNHDFTGRENIYLNGSVLGLTPEEIEARLEDILAFADIGDFIDQPVKTYSSGMFVRLAFAVQVNVDPEIFIVDEALSVGDFFFQQKCFARLRKMREDGLTLLFVSHDLGTVRDLCPNSIYLVKGKAAFVGDSQEAIRAYLAEGAISAPEETYPTSVVPEESAIAPGTLLEDAKKVALWQRDLDSLNNDHSLLAVVVRDEMGNPVTAVRMGSKLIIQVFFRSYQGNEDHIGLIIKNKYDHIISSVGTHLMGLGSVSSKNEPYGIFEFEIDCMIEAGLYSILVEFSNPDATNGGKVKDSTDWMGPLQIDWEYEIDRAPFLGMFGLPCKGRTVELCQIRNLLSPKEIVSRSILTGRDRSGAGGMEIIAACVTDEKGSSTFTVPMMGELRFFIYSKALRTVAKPYFAIVIYNQQGELIFTGTTVQIFGYSPELKAGQEMVVGFKVRFTIQGGQYTFRLSCAEPLEIPHPNKGVSLDAHGSLGPISVIFDYETQRAPFYGIAQLPMEML